jgi:PAS domain S-box-containing protein
MKRLSGESEEALLQLKNEMTAILENIDNGFISLDKGWRFVYINSKAAKNVGYEAKDLIGKNIWEVSANYWHRGREELQNSHQKPGSVGTNT